VDYQDFRVYPGSKLCFPIHYAELITHMVREYSGVTVTPYALPVDIL